MPVLLTPALISAGVSATAAPYLAIGGTLVIGIGLQLVSSFLLKPKQPKPSDGQVVIKESTSPRFRSYGRVKVAGVLIYANVHDAGAGARLYQIYALGSGEIDAVEEHWLDDGEVELGDVQDSGGFNVTTPRWIVDDASRVDIFFRLGDEPPAEYDTPFAEWTDGEHLGKGVPSAMTIYWQTEDKDFVKTFPRAGDTLYRQVQRGAKIRRITEGLEFDEPAWSDNAAAIIADYLTHPDGLRLPDSWILNAAQTWLDAQEICDGTVGAWDGGSEARYRIWNTYYFDERPADVLARFLQACDGILYTTPERGIGIRVGVSEEPTVTIDDDAILAFSDFGHGLDILTTANTIRGRITNPDEDYQEYDVEPVADEDDVAARGELATDIELYAAPSIGQAKRLMQLALQRAMPAWKGTIVCNLRALPAWGERYVNVTISELGISETKFEVLGERLIISDGNIVSGLELDIASAPSYGSLAVTCAHDFQYYQRTPDVSPLATLSHLPPCGLDNHGNYYTLESDVLYITDPNGTALADYDDEAIGGLINTFTGLTTANSGGGTLLTMDGGPLYGGRYVLVHICRTPGPFFYHWWGLLEPASDGSLTVAGALYYTGTTDAPFGKGIRIYEPYSTTQPILVGCYGSLGQTEFVIQALPSIDDFVNGAYAAGYPSLSAFRVRSAAYYPLGNAADLSDHFMHDSGSAQSRGLGFILPDASGNLFFYHYFNKQFLATVTSPSSPEIVDIIAPAYPDGCIIRVALGDDSYVDLAESGSTILGGTHVTAPGDYEIDNASWQNPDGSPATPFPDELTYISTDEAGGTDGYSMQIGGIQRRIDGTYWVSFYMTGYDDYDHYNNGEMFVRVKVFEFTPATQIGVLRYTCACLLRTDDDTGDTLAEQEADQFLHIEISESGFEATVVIYGPIYKTQYALFSTI